MNRAIENNSNCCVGCEHWLVASCAKIEDGKSSMTKDSSIPGTDAFVVGPPSRENSRHLLHRCHVRPGVFQTDYAGNATHPSGSFLFTMVKESDAAVAGWEAFHCERLLRRRLTHCTVEINGVVRH